MRLLSRICIGCLLASLGASASAAVVLDGSLGPKGGLTGPHFSLDASKGKRVGPNLFYSFSDFNLSKGDTASFSSHTPVKNVLARVTGGLASNIDGTLQVTIPNASFYLINPAGVVFGPDAKLDVKGSFAVTTANQIKLADGGHFNAQLPDTNLLTTAAPAAFGFLAKPKAISIAGAKLSVPADSRIIVASGNFSATNASITAPSGQISVSSSARAGDVSIARDLSPASPASASVTLDHSNLATDGASGGRIDIHAGDLTMNTSRIGSVTTGDQPGRGINLILSGNLTFDNSLIDASTAGAGAGGPIAITAADVSMSRSDPTVTNTGIASQSRSPGAGGNTGDITIEASSLHLGAGEDIDVSTAGLGNGGTIQINAGTIALDGTTATGQSPVGISGNTFATSAQSGSGGNIDVHAGVLRIINGGLIVSDSFGLGAAGNVAVRAGTIRVDAMSNAGTTGIASDSRGSLAGGPAGKVTVSADAVSLLNGGQITSNTSGPGRGGDVSVSAHDLTLDGGAAASFTGISSESLSAANGGSAGQIHVDANTIQMRNNAEIESDSGGLGAAGGVTVNARLIHIDGGNSRDFFTGISSDSDSPTLGGPAGDVTVSASTIQLLHGGQISSTTEGSGNGGNVTVSADSFAAKGDASGIFADSNSNGAGGDAGVIQLDVHSLELGNFGQIETDTSGAGNAGDIVIHAQSLNLDGAVSPAFTGISSESQNQSAGGRAGNVSIFADNMQLAHGAQILSDTSGSGAGGNITVAATDSLSIDGLSLAGQGVTQINASSEFSATGNAGAVTVQAGKLQIIRGGSIVSDTFGKGAGGSVHVRAASLTIDAQKADRFTGVSVNADLGSTGSAGDATINAGTLQLINGGNIRSDTFGKGRGGNINVEAKSITIDQLDSVTVTGIDASTEIAASGSAGNITVKADSLRIVDGGDIQADTFGKGNGGSVNVDTAALTIDATGARNFTGISAGADPGATGSAGNVTITGTNNSVQLLHGGELTSTTNGTGAGGNIQITAADFTSIGGSPLFLTGLFVRSTSTNALGGNAGDIVMHADRVSLSDGAILSTSTAGGGAAGKIQVFARDFAATGSDSFVTSGIFSESINPLLDAAGRAGDVIIHAASLSLDGGAALSALTNGSGRGGNVSLYADSLVFSGNASMNATSTGAGRAGDLQFHVGKMDLQNMDVLTRSKQTNGGNITIHASQRVWLYRSQLSTSAKGDGGNITIDPLDVSLNHSQVLANAFNGNGGNITINSAAFLASPDSIVNASSKFGLSGNVSISSPDTDVAQGLVQLSGSLAQQVGLQETCAQRFSLSTFSSFVVEGSGGIPLQPGNVMPSLSITSPTTQRAD